MEKKSYNLNFNVIIYPSELGWIKIRELISEYYSVVDFFDVDAFINKRRSEDGGFEEQLWVIMSMLGDAFFNGSRYLESTAMTLCGDISTDICDHDWSEEKIGEYGFYFRECDICGETKYRKR